MYNAKQELKALKLLIQLQEYLYMYNHKDSVYIITKHIFIAQNWSLELRLVIKIMEGDCF